MISYNPTSLLRFLSVLYLHDALLVYHQINKYKLTHQPACYNFMETIARTFIIPSGQNQFIQVKVLNNAPIRSVAIAMNTNLAFTGQFQGNPFHYQKFGSRDLRIVRGGRAIVSLDTTNYCRAYVATMKALNFNEKNPGLPNHQLQNHYILYSVSLHFNMLEKIFIILNSAVEVTS